MQPPPAHKPLYAHLYFQVLVAIAVGVALGYFYPALGTRMKPLGDGFIKLIKMVIAPIIFCTVVSGISHIDDARKVGRVGVKALVYFEIVSSFALIEDYFYLGLVNFVEEMARVSKGVAAYCSTDEIGNLVFDSFIGGRRTRKYQQ